MVRPRKNFPERQDQNERRYTDQMFALLQKLDLTKKKMVPMKVELTDSTWAKNEARKIRYEDGLTQLSANLKLSSPGRKLVESNLKKALYGLVTGLKEVPGIAISLGFLLILKVYETDESDHQEKAFYKIYNLTHAQDKVLSNSPQLLQQPFRLQVSLGLSEEQMVKFEEQALLENLPGVI